MSSKSDENSTHSTQHLQTNRPQLIVRAKEGRAEKGAAVLSLLHVPEYHFMLVGFENGDLLTLDLVSGSAVFRTNLGGAVLFLVHIPGGHQVFAGVTGDELFHMDLASGKVAVHGSLGISAVQCVVHVEAEMFCAGTANGTLAALPLSEEPTPDVFSELWRQLAKGFGFHVRLGSSGVVSLAHAPEKKQVFAGLGNGSLVTVNIPSGKVISSAKFAGGAVLSLAYIPGMMSVLVGMESGDLIRCDPEMGGIVASRLNLGVGMIKCLLYIQGLWTDDVILAGLWSGETVSVAKVVSVAKSY
jgi:hypothetical protein